MGKAEFAKGDWVSFESIIDGPKVRKIESFGYPGYWSEQIAMWSNGAMPLSRLRHATPEEIAKEKERAFFAKHGRKRWELREGDVLVNVYSGDPAIVTGISEDGYEIDGANLHRKIVRNSFRVVAFVEGRLDGVYEAHKPSESRRTNGNF